MTLVQPRAEIVRAFYRFMKANYATSLIDKRNAGEMQLVGGLLGQLGIVDKNAFLQKYATTIGHRLYVPFDPGVPTNDWDLWGQITVCVHEHQHVVQYDALGPIRFAWQYITSSAARARFEAEAYRCQLEMHWWRTRTILPPHELAALLRNYGVKEVDVGVAETAHSVSAESVRQGAIINPTSRVAIGWLETYAPYLKAPVN